jgi:hypothetical protein
MPLVPDYPQRMAGARRVPVAHQPCTAGNLVYALRVKFENSKKFKKKITNRKKQKKMKIIKIKIM